jgi:hypothetical protein
MRDLTIKQLLRIKRVLKTPARYKPILQNKIQTHLKRSCKARRVLAPKGKLSLAAYLRY